MSTVFGREPSVAVESVAAVALAILLLIPMSSEVNAAANAVILALAGLVTASIVAVDGALPALLGLIKAVFALILGLGMHLPDTTQVGILAVVSALGALFVRTSVVAPVLPLVRRPPAAPDGVERAA